MWTNTGGIFEGESLLSLLFVLCKVPLSFVLRRSKACYEWKGREINVKHLLIMDELKLEGIVLPDGASYKGD